LSFTSGDLIALGIGSVAIIRWVWDKWIIGISRGNKEASIRQIADTRQEEKTVVLEKRVHSLEQNYNKIDEKLDDLIKEFSFFTGSNEQAHKAVVNTIAKLERGIEILQAQIRNVATRSDNRFTDGEGKGRL